MQVCLYRQLYRPIHARLLLEFNKVSVSVMKLRFPKIFWLIFTGNLWTFLSLS